MFWPTWRPSSGSTNLFHTTAHTYAQVNPHTGHLRDKIPTWRPLHGPHTHTTTHAAKTPEGTPFQPRVSTTIYHPIRDRDHTYTNPLTHLLSLFHRYYIDTTNEVAASMARHRNQGADPTSNLHLRPWHTLAAMALIAFSLYIAIQKIDDEISTTNSLNPWDILSPIAC